MIGFDNVIWPHKLKFILDYLAFLDINYGWVYMNINTKDKTTWTILAALFVVLYFKNSMEKMGTFKTSRLNFVYNVLLFLVSVSLLKEASEFLYYNF
jgi:hypothetical protein